MPIVPYPEEWSADEAQVQADAVALANVEQLFLAVGGPALKKFYAEATAKAASSAALSDAKSILSKELVPKAVDSLEAAGAALGKRMAEAMKALLVPTKPDELFTREAAATMARAWSAVIERRLRDEMSIELNHWLLPLGLSKSPKLVEMLAAARKPFGLSDEQASAIMKDVGAAVIASGKPVRLPENIDVLHTANGFRAEKVKAEGVPALSSST